jgi:hypothetical protein
VRLRALAVTSAKRVPALPELHHRPWTGWSACQQSQHRRHSPRPRGGHRRS